MFKTLNYDTSAYEIATFIPKGLNEWTQADILIEFEQRLERELAKRELQVYYYRIGHRIAFQLPVDHLPELPAGIPQMGGPYPWSIWLAWDLRERWEILHTAWRKFGNHHAGDILQNELSAIEQWDRTNEGTSSAGLCTAYLMTALALYLPDASGWDSKLYHSALTAAHRLIDRDIIPWFETSWKTKTEFTTNDIHNIPSIILLSAAFLARTIQHPLASTLDEKATLLFHSWCRFRLSGYSEGTSYDGFLLDSMTQWMDSLPNKTELLKSAQPAFKSVLDNWIHHTLPGRVDLHAPIADVEPEMFFWINATGKFAQWYSWGNAVWILKRIAPVRLPATVLVNGLETLFTDSIQQTPPQPGCLKHASSVTMRTGWKSEDIAVIISASTIDTHHLHYDNGQVVIGAYDTFWITDPGYQQYRNGPEREYSIGIEAHNAPVINGIAQSKRSSKLISLEEHPDKTQTCCLDITHCYENIPAGTSIQREITLNNHAITILDRFTSLEEIMIDYYWLGGTYLAWSFIDSNVRLSDGKHALLMSVTPGKLEPLQVMKHTGSRGPLTLHHSCRINSGSHVITWTFTFDAPRNVC